MRKGSKGQSPKDRFMSYVKKLDNGCWEWQGFCNDDGYGTFWFNGDGRMAHRWAHEHLGNGDPSFQSNHTCDNPPCVNPEHLVSGTQLDNMRDKHAKKRQPKSYKKAREKAIAEGRKMRIGTKMVNPLEVCH